MTTELTPLVSQWFEIHPMGITLKHTLLDKPPIEAFDLLGYSLAVKNDELKWQIAAWCNLYQYFYGSDVYIQKAAIVQRRPQTIEVWAYVERNVPNCARVPGLSLEFHRLVASVKDYRLQKKYLRLCRLFGLSHSAFSDWLKKRGEVETTQPSYSDRLFEAQREAYNNEVAYQEQVTENHRLQQRVSELEQTVIMPGEPIAPDDLPKYAQQALDGLENWLLECGYSSVTIYQNGDVKWHK